jgi:hypothetical protein
MFAKIFLRLVLGLVILGLLVGGVFAAYRMGSVQGYQAGLQASGNSAVQTAPLAPPYSYAPWFYYRPYFSPFGIIFPLLAIFFVIFLVSLPFRFMFGRRFFGRQMMAGGPEYDAWMKEHGEHFRHMHGHWSDWHDHPGPEHKRDQPGDEQKV